MRYICACCERMQQHLLELLIVMCPIASRRLCRRVGRSYFLDMSACHGHLARPYIGVVHLVQLKPYESSACLAPVFWAVLPLIL